MTPFANATTPAKAALGTTLALGASAVFLLVASNVLLLGLRLHDGGFHWLEIATGWPRYGADPRFDRWLTLSTLSGLIVVFGLLGAILRHRPPPLHGKARFASEREIKTAGLRSKDGLLLGRKDGKMLCFGGTEHVLLYAPTRAGKGVGYVIPNLLNWPDSVVALDVKKENWDRSAGFRASHGQEVHLFDPLDENGRTARYNPLGYVRSDPADLYDDLQRVAVMLFPAESRGDPFWFEAARSSFVAIGGYVAETPGLPLTIGEILRQLSATQDLKAHFDKIIADRKAGPSPLSRHCITALNDFLAASENTLNSVRKTVTARLGLWLNPRIDAATSTNDFDLRQLRQNPISIYLGVTPDNLDRMAPLLNLFFQQVVDLNTRVLPEQNPKLTRKVLLLLDEFPALGNVNVLAKSVAFIAGYGIRLLTVVQSPAQLRAIYGIDGARNFMTNHAVEVVFAPKEQDVANELSERIGYETVNARSRSGPKGLAMRAISETISEHRRALMLPQELKLLPKSKAFILGTGIPPIIADKIIYYEDKSFLKRLLPAPVPQMPKERSNALLDAEIKELRSEIAELRAVFRARPMTDEEVADPSTIPAGASFDFGDVDVDLDGLSEADMKAWVLNYIDAQAIPPARRPGRKPNEQQHERHT
ncbi:type IV secretory system conjugative DNA transfer family protein [Bradyrhizobium elkanii]|uniref:type IV secretory system conjugative DNA transfer family protein n=1 Tax=Bradyrhizobium elkanii TaxID=29448 RepID=UPI000486322B|nr:type IV secretory system conjugative DNA transfer family protein [Bradyrhizobium elkanii]MCS3453837.1 type IV secretion system protein VirD4 [Bradyrhizobium elkanii]MCS3566877.1 type IV secretion system protein VirD4 [Bradyrhizobium elkanii]MCW2153777.1 type IV secretion system protein VirD4 [Bradyrhizobium elkanii]MCW2380391.1 type IV secretion system protein VirD4 [Bradyrhizobium elkanii]WLC12565.1 type IV secretory system conjugative DNA transfer family protein [Bradyrhizobium elkanii US